MQEPAEKIGQPQRAARFAPPAAETDAGEHHLAIACCEMAHLFHDLVGRGAAAASAHEGNDAERAAVIAAILDLEVGPRTMGGRAFHRRGEEFVLIENIADVNLSVVLSLGLSHDFRDTRLVRVAYHPVHPWQYGDLLGRAL